MTLPPKRKRHVCLVCKLTSLGIHHPQHIPCIMLPAHICQVDSNGYISSNSNLIKNVIYSLLSETAVPDLGGVYSLCAYILLQIVIQFGSSFTFNTFYMKPTIKATLYTASKGRNSGLSSHGLPIFMKETSQNGKLFN